MLLNIRQEYEARFDNGYYRRTILIQMQRAYHLRLNHYGIPHNMLRQQIHLLHGPGVLTSRQIGDVLGMSRRAVDYHIHRYGLHPERPTDRVKGTIEASGIDLLVEVVKLRERGDSIPDLLAGALPFTGNPTIIGHLVDLHPDLLRRLRRKTKGTDNPTEVSA